MCDAGRQPEISVVQGDITTLSVDVIVNAANSSLSGGGGVDGAIHAAAGPSLMTECQEIFSRNGPCATGKAIITSGGRLEASWVVHAVGPVWALHEQAESAELLSLCYQAALDLAVTVEATTIAFPAISTGVYGFPPELAATIAVDAVKSWFEGTSETHQLAEVRFICFDDRNFQLTSNAVESLFQKTL